MHEATYLTLRDKLRERAANDELNREFMRRFIIAVEAHINKEVGREQTICSFGRIDPSLGFQKNSMHGYGSTMDFAFEVKFHDGKGTQIYQHAVPFKASLKEKQLTITCLATDASVTLTPNECTSEEGRKKVADLLEAPVRSAVEEQLADLAFA